MTVLSTFDFCHLKRVDKMVKSSKNTSWIKMQIKGETPSLSFFESLDYLTVIKNAGFGELIMMQKNFFRKSTIESGGQAIENSSI